MIYLGSISSFSFEKGCGFIESTEFNENVFFHASELIPRFRTPQIGDKVKFLIADEDGQTKAIRVTWFEEVKAPVSDGYNDKVRRTINKNLFKETNVLKTNKKINVPTVNDKPRLNKTPFVVAICVIALGFGGHYGWEKYQVYEAQQEVKMSTYLEHQSNEVIKQRQAIGYVPEVKFSEKSMKALNETN